MKPYASGTTAFQIILDGWCRGFLVSQTHNELSDMGYTVDLDSITLFWKMFDRDMEHTMKNE